MPRTTLRETDHNMSFREKTIYFFRNNAITRYPYRRTYTRVTSFIQERPFTSFFLTLGLLFLIILLGNIFGGAKAEKAKPALVKSVSVYAIGEAPKVVFQGKIDKIGVAKITALAGGVVQSIPVQEGDTVYKGTQILSLSSNYQGGNAAALQAQIAERQYKNVTDTYDEQTDLINKQKDIANKTNENAVNLQNLNAIASTESASLINSNQDYLNSLNQSLSTLQTQNQVNPDPATQQQIQQLQGSINQLQGGLNQLRQGQRQLAYQADSNQPPAELANLQKDITLKQLDVQQKSLDMNKELSKLQAELAEVSASAMYPASPFAGTVQRIYVNVGQAVSPGTLLATVASNTMHTSVVVNVPENVAKNISRLEASNLYLGTHIYIVRPTFVSTEATDGSLYTVLYSIPDEDSSLVTDASYIKVEIPVGSPSTGATVPFVPIDAVYQTQDTSYLLVMNKQRAVTREVTLGSIYGSYVEVTSGLKSGDQVILDRNVVAGDRVEAD